MLGILFNYFSLALFSFIFTDFILEIFSSSDESEPNEEDLS